MNTPLRPTSFDATRLATFGDRLDLVSGLAARPTISHEDTPATLENAAVAAIAEEVLGAARLTLTAAISEPGGALSGTAEGEVARAMTTMPFAQRDGKAAAMQERASAMLDADRKAMAPVFGRVVSEEPGGIPAGGKVRDVLGRLQGGVVRAVDTMDLRLDPKHVGLRQPSISLPLSPSMRFENGNLVVPRDLLGSQFEDAGDFEAVMSGVENAEAGAATDGVIDAERFEMAWGEMPGPDPYAESDFEAVTDKLRLHVVSVRCADETNPEWWGDDEIALAGVSIDEDGDTKRIPERFVGSGFRDGRSKTLNWSYHYFGLNESHHFPKRYGVTFILAEKDNGGLGEALQRLWTAVKDAVSTAIRAAAQAAGTAVAAFLQIPAAASVIAAAISRAADWILNRLISWIIGLFDDDIFPTQTAWITIPSLSARWTGSDGAWGSTWSPLMTKRFRGHGGTYDLTYRWQLYA